MLRSDIFMFYDLVLFQLYVIYISRIHSFCINLYVTLFNLIYFTTFINLLVFFCNLNVLFLNSTVCLLFKISSRSPSAYVYIICIVYV